MIRQARKTSTLIWALAASIVFIQFTSCNFGPPENSRAAQAMRGKAHFDKYCVTCHGQDGKGLDIEGLERRPADLTRIGPSNDFPVLRVAHTIDGRDMPSYHKESGMPLWGDVFTQQEGLDEKELKGRLGELIAYLMSIQEK